MKRVRLLHGLTTVAIASTLSYAGQASASGFQLQEQSASGLGVAYSGMAAAVQDASTVFWNPAGMTGLPGRQVTLAAHYIMPRASFASSGPAPAGSSFHAFGNGGQGGESAWVPAAYATWMVDPRWSVGVAVNAPFGLGTEWDSRWAGQFHAIKSEVETLNINPSVGFKVNNTVSLGAGVSYQQVKATLTNAASPLIAGSQGQVKGDSWAWGWNVGALIDFGQGTRLGLTYRSAIAHTVEGALTLNNPLLAAGESNVKAAIKLPQTFSLGLSHQFNPRLRGLADWTWTGWDSIQSLDIVRTNGPAAGATAASTALNFKNSWRLGAGLEYQVSQPWLLRAGLAQDRTPVQDAFRTPRLPDGNRVWLGLGARYQPGPSWWLDFGYAHLWIADTSSNLTPAGVVPGRLVGEYKSSTDILAVQASFKF